MRKLFTLKKFNIFLFILVLVEIPVLIFVLFFLTNKTRFVKADREVFYSNKTEQDLEFEEIKKVSKNSKSVNDVFVSGWIPDYDIPDGLASVKEQRNNFDSISPVWFWVNEDGSLKKNGYSNGKDFLTYTNSQNLELIPTITLFDHEILSKVLNNKDNFNRHVAEIVKNLNDNNYDGIDLDYESIYLKDKDKFFKLLEVLRTELDKTDKKLVFTALPKWGNEVSYDFLPETRKVQDYKRIADIVDEFRIMTYEFYGLTSTEAGPLAPLEWMEFVLQYTIKEGVPREKIVLGVHTYIYDWSDRPVAKNVVEDNEFKVGLSGNLPVADAFFYKDLEKIRTEYNLTETFNEEWGEVVGTYIYKGEKRIVIYPNQQSLDLRKQLAADYGIKGVAYWRVGDGGSLKY